MLDAIGGTLLADEFDQRADTELAAALNRIINQGFQANRPLIKCDGEDMVPRPYRCFGPKLFALRGQLGDDASESRTISIRMRQRTRKDIPINLPRRQFDEQALQLRNRLLQYRFENLGRLRIDPEQADPRLEDRFNQIGLPLLAVASSEQRRVILTALSSQQEGIAGTRGQTLAGMVLQAALKSGAVSGEARPGEVAQEVNLQRAKADGLEVKDLGRERMSSHKAGRILAHDLELPPAPKDARGAKYRLEPSRVAQLCRRFGVDLPETSQSSLSPQNGPHDPQVNDVSDVCDDSDVSGEPGGGDWQDV
jgi:hypothetical protein